MPTQNIFDLVDTWASGGGPYTSIKMNATDNDVGSASLLMDLQVGGSSKFKVAKDGNLTTAGATVNFGTGGGYAVVQAGGLQYFQMYNSFFSVTRPLALSSDNDTILTRRAAANLRLGAADAAAPVAQTLSVQSVVAGTSNTAGANFTITGSQGTGTGAGGSIIFQVAPAGSTGTAQNGLATALTLNGDRTISFADILNGASSISVGARLFIGCDASTQQLIGLNNGMTLRWGSGSTVAGSSTYDTILARDAANTLALRNGANAQTFRVYNTTDGTNSEFGFAQWSSNVFQIGTGVAGTGTNRGINIAAGNGIVNFNSEFAMFNAVLRVTASNSINWSSLDNNINDGFDDTGLSRAAANVLRLTNGSTGGGSLQLTEMTAPAAPATNNVRIYAEDNGSGKTRLMALFPTGAAVQIAIEP